jgi:hypothetical protein
VDVVSAHARAGSCYRAPTMALLSLPLWTQFLAMMGRPGMLRETRELTAGKAQVGEISWEFGTPLVAVRDVFMPERVDAWGHFPGKPDQPVLRMTIEVRQGIPAFTRVEVAATTGGIDITGVHLGLVRDNLDWWLEMIVRNSAQKAPELRAGAEVDGVRVPGWDTVTTPDWADSEAASKAVRAVRRGRPRKATDSRHERVAMIYKAHISGKPLEAIRDAFRDGNGNNISRRTAARYVEAARTAGYLPATTQGVRKA